MGEPYLDKGEAFIVTTHRISVDFVLYDMMLTTRHLILIDNRSSRFEIRKIPLSTILSVAAGKLATGEPVITISFTGEDGTEPLPPMNLLFTQQATEHRKRERDEWIRKLMQQIVAVRQPAEPAGLPREGEAENPPQSPPTPMRGVERPLPHKSVIGTEPVLVSLEVLPEEPAAEETAQPVSPAGAPVMETFPEAAREEPGAPAGTAPEEPAGGTGSPGETGAQENEPAAAAGFQEPGLQEEEQEHPSAIDPFTAAALAVQESAAASAAPSATPAGDELPPAPVQKPWLLAWLTRTLGFQGAGKDDRDRVAAPLGSQGPSAPENGDVPAGSETARGHPGMEPDEGEPAIAEPAIATTPVTGFSAGSDTGAPPEETAVPSYKVPEKPVPVPEPTKVIPEQELPAEQIPYQPEGQPEESPELAAPVQPSGLPAAQGIRRTGILAAILIVILIIIAGGIFYSAKYAPGHSGLPTTPVVTPLTATPLPVSPVPAEIPADGLWLRVSSNASFVGYYGNPGNLRHVGGSGDRFYGIPDDGRLVQVSFQKQDYSGETLAIGVYRNGTMITSRSVRAPMGSIDFIIDPATGGFPGGIPTPS